jgi:hypothetical protein
MYMGGDEHSSLSHTLDSVQAAESKRAMAASIERVPRLLEQLSELAVEDRRFCTLLFEPSPNRCIVSTFRICGIRCGILYDPDLPVPRRPHLRLC